MEKRMAGKVCLITGATSGIGRETAQALARQGAAVVIVGRDKAKAERTAAQIKKESGNPNVEYLLADLSIQAEVRRLAGEFLSRYDRLDVLVNNAGAIFLRRKESRDGIEMTFALNHLNYFLLTNLLLDRLKKSAPARIISVSSAGHLGASIDFGNLQMEKGYWGFEAYGRTKLCNVLFTYELARRLKDNGVTANAVHPGLVATNIGRNNGLLAWLFQPLIRFVAKSPREGAETLIYLASSPEVEGVSGKYFANKRAVRSSANSHDEETARRLWQASAEMTGIQ
jgi:NAD(P)-dependent dehydrogenase (short-subunit alcohol dehydrogenase family)